MEKHEALAGDAASCSVRWVEKKSSENQDVRKFVKERGFVYVGQTIVSDSECYDVFQRALDADTEEEKEEEEETKVSIEPIIDFADIDHADDPVFGEHRGRTGKILPAEPKTTSFIKGGDWSLEDRDVQELRDIGVKSLNLKMQLIAEKNVDVGESVVLRDGPEGEQNAQGRFTKIQLVLDLVTVDLQAEPSKESTSIPVVHKIEIKLLPAEVWAGGNQCSYPKVSPSNQGGSTREASGSATLSPIPGVQMTKELNQHEWRSNLVSGTKAAEWVWSIGYWCDNKCFNPSKTNLFVLKGGSTNPAKHSSKFLGPGLAEEPLQLKPPDVSALWTVNAQVCDPHSFDFVVEVRLHITVFCSVNIFAGSRAWVSGPKQNPMKIPLKGRLSIK